MQRDLGDVCVWINECQALYSSHCEQSELWFDAPAPAKTEDLLLSLHRKMTLSCPGGYQGKGEMQTEEVFAVGGRRPVSMTSLPDAQLAAKGIARAKSCLAQSTEHHYFIHLLSPPPCLTQLQYCRKNLLQLPEEEQTSETRRAFPSPPCFAVGCDPQSCQKAGRVFDSL